MKSIRHSVLGPTVVCSLILIACSSSTGSGEATGRSQQAATAAADPACRRVVLDAERTYGPSGSSSDGTTSVSPAMKFDLPREIKVTAGRAGKGSVTLALVNGLRSITCTYRGHEDGDGDGDDYSRWRSREPGTYRIDRCDHRVDEDVSATDLTLHIVGGDSADPAKKTDVELVLHEEHPCRGDLDAGTVTGTDAGADTGPACDLTLCNDGNPCTIDSCAVGGGCAHTTAADGTACYDGNLCVFSNSETCTAGVCGNGVPDCGGAECVSSGCDATSGQCLPAPAGTPCSMGACDGNYSCMAAVTPATAVTFLSPVCALQTTSECTAKACTFVPGTTNCSCAPLPYGAACSTGICDGASNCVPTGSPSDAGTGGTMTVSASCPLATACLSSGALDLSAGANACAYVDLAAGTACSGGTCDGAGKCGP
jgi:hypothetical protein